jgi:hypothetical protein
MKHFVGSKFPSFPASSPVFPVTLPFLFPCGNFEKFEALCFLSVNGGNKVKKNVVLCSRRGMLVFDNVFVLFF